MGQDHSSAGVDDSTPPQRLKDRSLISVATFIRQGRAKRIVVMVGAGVSTSAGIPDFRSPETGLYANLTKLDLPFAEAVFDISFFRKNPLPFYTLAHELQPGLFKPTISHSFVRLLSEKGLLYKLFTQNIDCLERRAGVPDDKIVEAHGSFIDQHCIECKSSYPQDLMDQAVKGAEVPHCVVPQCNGLVKPDIVFFGEPLPEKFHNNRVLPSMADLCIVMGTSLSVQPFASLPSLCAQGVPRLLINSERVGNLGSRTDDVLLLGDCDAGVRQLAAALGWEDELEALWNKTCGKETHNQAIDKAEEQSKNETLNQQILKLTREVDKSLRISNEHDVRMRKQLAEHQSENQSCDPLAGLQRASQGESVDRQFGPGVDDLAKSLSGEELLIPQGSGLGIESKQVTSVEESLKFESKRSMP